MTTAGETLGPDGAIARSFDGFAPRSGQRALADHEVDRVPKPDLAARMVMKRIFRFYRHNLLDTPEHTREQLAKLEPELNHGEFQVRGWIDAFNRLYEL